MKSTERCDRYHIKYDSPFRGCRGVDVYTQIGAPQRYPSNEDGVSSQECDRLSHPTKIHANTRPTLLPARWGERAIECNGNASLP